MTGVLNRFWRAFREKTDDDGKRRIAMEKLSREPMKLRYWLWLKVILMFMLETFVFQHRFLA